LLFQSAADGRRIALSHNELCEWTTEYPEKQRRKGVSRESEKSERQEHLSAKAITLELFQGFFRSGSAELTVVIFHFSLNFEK
jgi:transposase